MDNAAFRSLLAAPKSDHAVTPVASSSRARFGAPPPKRSAAGSSKSEGKEASSNLLFKPRETSKNKDKYKKKSTTSANGTGEGTGYRDRAAERRQGKEGDFAQAEKLLEDFKARTEGTMDKKRLEEQLKYLGGDAEHSVLVKGLDMALLERKRHEQSLASEETLDQVEKVLDRVLADKSAAAAAASVTASAPEARKRTRDDILAELKASRGISTPSEGIVESKFEEAKAAGKFKPINQKGKVPKEISIEGSNPTLRRQKKVKKVEEAPAKDGKSPAAVPSTIVPELTSKGSTHQIPPIDDGLDSDPFADAGDYKPFGDSDSDDELETENAGFGETAGVQISPSVSRPLPKPDKYFEDDDDDNHKAGYTTQSTAPQSVTNLSSVAVNGVEVEKEEDIRLMKLQPLSGSRLPSVKDLLAMDAAAEKEEQRKAKHLNRNNSRPGEEKPEKKMSHEDKSNKDFQIMSNYLEEQEKRKLAKPTSASAPSKPSPRY